MASLTVWKFETPEGAQDALNKVTELSKQQLIQLQDCGGRLLAGRQEEPQDPQLRQHDWPGRALRRVSGACSSA